VRWRVELVGGPLCGHWWQLDELPAEREFEVAVPVDGTCCVYFLETDEMDAEQRASFVRLRLPEAV
jgi:hypothetical protein